MAKAIKRSPILGAVSAMIGEASDTLVTNGGRFRHSFEVDVTAITPDPLQARRHFDTGEIASLAATMAEQGQLQPILLRRDPDTRGRWVIIAGERRWRAAQHNGWKTILAIEHAGDAEVAALIENLQRIDLSPVEEARGLQRLISEKKWTQDRAAAALAKSKAEVSATLGILTLPSTLLDQVLTSELSLSKNVLVELARVEDPQAMQRLVQLAGEGGLTVRIIRQARLDAQRTRDAFVQNTFAAPAERPAPPALPGVAKLEKLLRMTRESATPLTDPDRDALRRLRAEIDALLGTP